MTHQQIHQFVIEFFQYNDPVPQITQFNQEELKNNDMKIILEIATKSTLRMQSEPKTNTVSFSCKNFGKSCFEIFGKTKGKNFVIQTDYKLLKHKRSCELYHEQFEYLKIYNLMKLKKNLIENLMKKNNLSNSSPSEILGSVSVNGEYFFQERIKYHSEMRRKLRKRFDNIINIDIKKITKKEILNPQDQQLSHGSSEKKIKQKLNIQSQKKVNSHSGIQKSKQIKKIMKKVSNESSKSSIMMNADSSQNQQNIAKNQIKSMVVDGGMNFISFKSIAQLKEIKELNQQYHCFNDIFYGFSLQKQSNEQLEETIIDKYMENTFFSYKNGLPKNIFEIKSILNFPEQMGQVDYSLFDEQIV